VAIGTTHTLSSRCTSLRQSGADTDSIQWVVPRDSWLINRVTMQNGSEFFHEAIGGQVRQMTALEQARSVEDLFLRQWVRESRLDGFGKLMANAPKEDGDKQAVIAAFREQAMAAMANIPRLLG
jgi:hypothetical protein